MTLQSSGAISLANVQTEFGGSNPISISEYYGAASGVPTSGTISLSNFYGKSAAPQEIQRNYFASAYSSSWGLSWSTSGHQAGNLYILAVFKGKIGSTASGSIATPSGWTLLQTANWVSSSGTVGRMEASLFYRTSVSGSVTITNTGSYEGQSACLSVWRNATIKQSTTGGSGNATCNYPPLTSTTNGRYLYWASSAYSASSGSEASVIPNLRGCGNNGGISNWNYTYYANSANSQIDPYVGMGYNVYPQTSDPPYNIGSFGGTGQYYSIFGVRL